jgi:hypothetical protein
VKEKHKYRQVIGKKGFSCIQILPIKKKKPPDKWFEVMYRLEKKF